MSADATPGAAPTMLRLVIVDDEPLARLRLRALIEGLPGAGASVVGEAGDADAALSLLQTTAVDAVLLDIRLPGRDGLRLAAALQALRPAPAVVFVTAHAEHALQAFELAAVDYLTKPVRRERLLASLQRLRRARAADVPAAAPADALASAPAAPAAPVEGPPMAPALLVSDRGRMLRLPHAELLYVKAEQKYLTLRTASQRYVVDGSLAEIEVRLGAAYVRIHRNALVARHAIRALALRDAGADADADGWAVCIAPLDEWLAVSRRQLAQVRAALAG